MLGDAGLLLGDLKLVKWFDRTPELVYDTMKKVQLINKRLKTAQIQQKSYSYVRRRELVFEVVD